MKKLVYLISQNKINDSFYNELKKVLTFKNVKFFQLRLKKVKKSKIIKIAKEIRKITKKYKVKLIINDHINISKITNADWCHLGQSDSSVINARKHLKRNLSIPLHENMNINQIEHVVRNIKKFYGKIR